MVPPVRRLAAWGAVCGAVLVTACSALPAPPPPVDPPNESHTAIASPVLDSELLRTTFTVPDYESPADIIFNSPLLANPEFWEEVERYIGFWRRGASDWFPRCLQGMSWFEAMVDSSLVANDLPRSLRYLPVLESCYLPNAVSSASAVGLWQFMAPTARGLGLEVGRFVDERRDPYAATEAAIRFLTYLHNRFDSWFLALAAYNGGPGRLGRIIERYHPLAPRTDELYWEIREHLPRETRDFVAKFFSGMLVARSPTTHGYERPPTAGFEFDEVTVTDAVTLDVVALATGTTEEEIARLNPKYVRGMTPPGRRSSVRVPKGNGAGFHEALERIPPEQRVSFVEHVIESGETLSHIARKYGVTVADLREANPGVRARYLRVGDELIVPIVPGWSRGG